VLDGEGLVIHKGLPGFTTPAPLSCFVEDDVTDDDDARLMGS
jgi:hypothetical protein